MYLSEQASGYCNSRPEVTCKSLSLTRRRGNLSVCGPIEVISAGRYEVREAQQYIYSLDSKRFETL